MEYEIKEMTSEEAEQIEEKNGEENDLIAPPVEGAKEDTLVFKALGEDGDFLGGLIASLDTRGTIELENLWIDERCRGRGIGSAIIRAAEREAKARGCYMSIVSTWSYQARPLYEKHGYTLCSTVTDWPKGYDSYYLSKRLDRPARGYVPKNQAADFEIVFGTEQDGEFIHKKLHEYNCSRVPRLHGHEEFARKLVGEDGEMIAGCAADKDSLDIVTLGTIRVEAPYRGRGLGSYLLGEVEREIKAAGGIFTVAYAFDWQAGFFRKNGYAECGVIEDFPKGHRMYVLKKPL